MTVFAAFLNCDWGTRFFHLNWRSEIMANKRKRTPPPNPRLLKYLEFQQQRNEAIHAVRRGLTEILRSKTSDHIAIGCIQRLIRWRMLDATSAVDAASTLNNIILRDSADNLQKRRAQKAIDEINALTFK